MKKSLLTIIVLLFFFWASAQNTINFIIPECPTVGIEIGNERLPVMHLYPNPAQDVIYVATDAEMLFAQIDVFDVLGRKTNISFEPGTHSKLLKINLHDLPKGVYFLNIKTGFESFQKSFIIL